jgi:hypothetical protein
VRGGLPCSPVTDFRGFRSSSLGGATVRYVGGQAGVADPHGAAKRGTGMHPSRTSRRQNDVDAASWFSRLTVSENPVDHLESLRDALRGTHDRPLEQAIAEALAFCIAQAPDGAEYFEAAERLPLTRARDEYVQWQALKPAEFLARVLEIWVLAQHAYWCVGRGLADVRGRGKTLLQLKVVMDEGGWTLTPGTRPGNPPIATRDRLESALGLLAEWGRLPPNPAMTE